VDRCEAWFYGVRRVGRRSGGLEDWGRDRAARAHHVCPRCGRRPGRAHCVCIRRGGRPGTRHRACSHASKSVGWARASSGWSCLVSSHLWPRPAAAAAAAAAAVATAAAATAGIATAAARVPLCPHSCVPLCPHSCVPLCPHSCVPCCAPPLQELDLKTRPFWALLRHMQPPLDQAANINLAWWVGVEFLGGLGAGALCACAPNHAAIFVTLRACAHGCERACGCVYVRLRMCVTPARRCAELCACGRSVAAVCW